MDVKQMVAQQSRNSHLNPSNVMTSLQGKIDDHNELYSRQHYKWDGKARPKIDDYISPWINVASETMYSSAFNKNRKEHNKQVTYAKNQLEIATKQFNEDLAFWNERDERDYTDQASQAQRYEDAGFNMGYMYDKIDSGNSAVGYNQQDASIQPADNSANELDLVKTVSSVVATCVSAVTSLINTGVKLKELPARIKQMTASGELTQVQADWQKVLQSVDKGGHAVDDVTKSLAFELQTIGAKSAQQSLDIGAEQLKQLQEFTNKCASIYEIQGTDPRKEASNALQEMIKGLDLSWLGENQGFGRFILQMLGFWAVKDM